MDRDLLELPEAELQRFVQVPASLEEALDALANDDEFLVDGGVFTADLIATWIDLEQRSEVETLRARLHPWEFTLYYDC